MAWKTLPVLLAGAIASSAAETRSLHIEGIAGYLSEWELSGLVTESGSGAGTEFAGRLIWKHVGLCSVQGAPEKYGEVRLRMSPAGRVHATFWIDEDPCSYSAESASSSSGYLECSQAKGIPLSLSIR
jgi:hypothetical protein